MLMYLNNLPVGLVELNCESNKLINLNNLPKNLKLLEYSYNYGLKKIHK